MPKRKLNDLDYRTKEQLDITKIITNKYQGTFQTLCHPTTQTLYRANCDMWIAHHYKKTKILNVRLKIVRYKILYDFRYI